MRDERARDAVQAVPEDVRFTTFHLIGADGTGFSGGEAVVETLAAISWTARAGRVLRRRPLLGVVGVLYRALVKSKGVLGKLVEDAPGPERWP